MITNSHSLLIMVSARSICKHNASAGRSCLWLAVNTTSAANYYEYFIEVMNEIASSSSVSFREGKVSSTGSTSESTGLIGGTLSAGNIRGGREASSAAEART